MTGDMFIGIAGGITALLLITLYIIYRAEDSDDLW